MKRTVNRILTLILLGVFLFSTGRLTAQWLHRQQRGSSEENAARLAYGDASRMERQAVSSTQPPEETEAAPPEMVWVPAPVEDDPNMEDLAQIDLSQLRQVNEDVVGWIVIPGTVIDYPLMQGEDNDQYLHHTWDGVYSVYGSIFLEWRNDRALTDFNTIIYGHNMRDRSMFASLHDYRYQQHWEQHPYIYLVTDAGVLRYEVFSSYVADVESKTYGLSFREEKTREEFLQMALENSQIDTGVTPAVTDRIITLSTCTGMGYDSRRVVHARLVMMETEAE